MTVKNNLSPTASATYAQAGVSIEAGSALVDVIKPLAKATSRPGVLGGLGGFGALFDLKATGYRDPILVATTDGVGTKLKLAIDTGHFATIGIDLVAMCVNDLVVQGAEPLFFLDYYACGALSVGKAGEVIRGIAEGCTQAGCALTGGETAEMPGLYQKGDFDLAGFAVGVVERDQILPRASLTAGDVVIGLASSGVHSNGYSLVRHLIAQHGLNLDSPAPFAPGLSLGEALLTPTRIYVKPLLEAIRSTGAIKALAHITGGGLVENPPRILPESLGMALSIKSWPMPPVFGWLQALGNIDDNELRRTFNCGIGMILVVEESAAATVKNMLNDAGEQAFIIGELTAREASPVTFHG